MAKNSSRTSMYDITALCKNTIFSAGATLKSYMYVYTCMYTRSGVCMNVLGKPNAMWRCRSLRMYYSWL